MFEAHECSNVFTCNSLPRCICIGTHGLFCITVCLFHYLSSSGDLGIGTVGPIEEVKGCIVGVTKLVDHTGGNVCVDGAGGNVCVEEIVDGEAETMGEWMQEVVDWIGGGLSTTLGSVWGV